MSWLEFIAQLLSSLAWPSVAIFFLIFLRGELKTLVRRIIERTGDMRRVQFPGGSIDFRDEVRELADDVESRNALNESSDVPAIETEHAKPLPPETPTDRVMGYEGIARYDPKAAILVSFADLEGLLRRTYKRYFKDRQTPVSLSKIISDYQRENYISAELAHDIRKLARLKSQVAHGAVTRVEEETALEYVEAMGTTLSNLMTSRLYAND